MSHFQDQFHSVAESIYLTRQETGLEGLVKGIDHIAYRVATGDREQALAEILRHSNYTYLETHFMPDQNALTSVLRFGGVKPAIVVSEGLDETSIVSQYVKKNGPRIHHVAFEVTDIHAVIAAQRSRGVKFTTAEVIGDENEGLLQIFTEPSPFTGDIYEYVQRFNDFKGFFLQSHVGALMESTQRFNK